MKKLVVVFGLLWCSLFGCVEEKVYLIEGGPSSYGLSQHQETIISMIEGLPDWTELSYGPAEVEKVVEIAKEINMYTDSEIESALVALSDKKNFPYQNLEMSGKAFIIMRALFELPSSVSASQGRYYSCFHSLADDVNTIHVGWPLEFQESTLTNVNLYTGCMGNGWYDFLGEFQEFKLKYARRTTIKAPE